MTHAWIWPFLIGLALCPRRHAPSYVASSGWTEIDFWIGKWIWHEIEPGATFDHHSGSDALVRVYTTRPKGVTATWYVRGEPYTTDDDGMIENPGDFVIRFVNTTADRVRVGVSFRMWRWA